MINRPNTANFLSKYIDFGQAILAEIKSILRSPDEIPADVWPLSRDRRLKPSTDPFKNNISHNLVDSQPTDCGRLFVPSIQQVVKVTAV